MKKVLALLLAGILCVSVFSACGNPTKNASANPSPSPTPEQVVEKFTDNDIEAIKEKAASIVLTDDDRSFLVDFATALLPVVPALSSVSELCNEDTVVDDEWRGKIKALGEQMETAYKNAELLVPGENCKELCELAMAGIDAAKVAVEKASTATESNDSVLDLTLGYFDLCIKYITAANECIEIVYASQPAPDVPLEIGEVKLSENSIGTPEISLIITNTGEIAVDAVDIRVEARDAYGELIKIYGKYTYFSLTYQDNAINPGGKSADGHIWTLTGVQNMKSVRLAVEKYHLTDGNTVTINEAQLQWSDWN